MSKASNVPCEQPSIRAEEAANRLARATSPHAVPKTFAYRPNISPLSTMANGALGAGDFRIDVTGTAGYAKVSFTETPPYKDDAKRDAMDFVAMIFGAKVGNENIVFSRLLRGNSKRCPQYCPQVDGAGASTHLPIAMILA
ncbi:hypothetical protein [Xanthomonas albilineans]|uniref:hypothetical protein n=1 Tax=Xanthomonas albilineans TaxID=29447 RepID=UPI000A6E2008|nr:hypothetical protein [Xanthomonas albilineans]